MEYRTIILVFCLICSTIANEDIIDDDRKNPIIDLFEAPLRAFRTQPGEAIAVFEPELVRQANNDTNGISSWFQAGQNIGSAAGALTGWIRNRISSTSTTSQPDVIVQVHQVERPKPTDNNNNGLDGIHLGPNNNIAKRKQQETINQINDDIDEIEEELNNIENNNNNNDNDDDDNDNNDSNDDDNNNYHVNRNRNNNNKYNKIRNTRNRNDKKHRQSSNSGSHNRNFNNNLRYDYDDDDDNDDEYDEDDDSYRDGAGNDYDDDDDDDSDEYHNNIINRRRNQQGYGNRISYNRINQNRRPIHYINNNVNRPPIRHIQQNEFYQPFQDMPPLARPIRYGVNNNNDNFQPQAIGVLKQQQQMNQRRKQQQMLQQQLQKQKQQQQLLQKQQQLQNQQQLQKQQEQQQNNRPQQIELLLSNQQQQQPQQNRPQQLELLLNNQQQHVLIPIQVLPNSVPYTQILPQIQVVAQHHHTIEPTETVSPAAATDKPNRRNRTKRPNRRRPEQNFDDDDDNLRPARRTTTTTKPPRPTTTRRPNRPSRTTRRTTTTTTTTMKPMASRKPDKGNKFEINRRKPSTVLRSETPAGMPDQNRPDAPQQLQNNEQLSEEYQEDEQMPLYKPLEPIMEPIMQSDIMNMSEENNGDAMDDVEPKSGDARAQYYLPQRYYKILGSNSYLALNNNGRFLLRTGRKTDPDKKDVVIKLATDNDNLKLVETTKEEKLVSAAEISTKPIINEPSKIIESEVKIEIEQPKLLPVSVHQIKTNEENVKKDVKIDDKTTKVEIKEVVEKVNDDKSLKVTTVQPIKVEEHKPVVVKEELIGGVETVGIVKPTTEKIVLRSEVVQEKQNGNLIIKSENAATLPKIETISIEKVTSTETTKETS